MAIFFMRCGIIGRTNANYTNMQDVSNYRNIEKSERQKQKGENRILHTEVVAPFLTPNKFKQSRSLWKEVEKKEKRKDAQLAREIIIALPKELDLKKQAKIIKIFCKKNLNSKGMICDYSIHNQNANNGNYHAHILCTLRKVEKGKFINKERSWNNKNLVKDWQKSWEKIANEELIKKKIKPIEHKKKQERQPRVNLKTYHFFKEIGKEMMKTDIIKIKEKDNKAKIFYDFKNSKIFNSLEIKESDEKKSLEIRINLYRKFIKLKDHFLSNTFLLEIQRKLKQKHIEIQRKLKQKQIELERLARIKEKQKQAKIIEFAKNVVKENFSRNIFKITDEGLNFNSMTDDENKVKYIKDNLLSIMSSVAKENPEFAPKNDEIQKKMKLLEKKAPSRSI